MYHHVKKLMYTVRVDEPDPKFGNMLLEQFGGANGELAAAMQYSVQGLNCEDPARKDLLMDIGTEELSHLEVVGTLARMHLRPMKAMDVNAAEQAKKGDAVLFRRSKKYGVPFFPCPLFALPFRFPVLFALPVRRTENPYAPRRL